MPTPTALSSGAASKMRQAMPARCSIRPSVNPPMPAPMMSTSMAAYLVIFRATLAGSFLLRERGQCAPGGDRGQPERYQHVPAGEREAEETPGYLVAADRDDVVQFLEDIAGGAEFIDRPRAVDRPLPPLPFDAGVIHAKPAVPEHKRGNYGKARDHHLARRAVIGADKEQRRERNAEIVGLPLLQAERARRQVQEVLEEVKDANGQHADDGDDARGGKLRLSAGQGKRIGQIIVHSAHRMPS